MKKEIPVVVIVPDAAKSGVRMPVLYLLHGYSGDQETWLNVKPSLPQMADRDSVIVVCPDGENSWYWDSPKDPSSRFETFVARELIDYVAAHYPTRGDRSGRAITGLSMGGHGGLWLSFMISFIPVGGDQSQDVGRPYGDDPVGQHIERRSGVGDRLRLRRLLFRREQQTARGASRTGYRA